jgi:hypothetical protein
MGLLRVFSCCGHDLLRLVAELGSKPLMSRQCRFRPGDLLFVPRGVRGDLRGGLAVDADLFHVLADLLAART